MTTISTQNDNFDHFEGIIGFIIGGHSTMLYKESLLKIFMKMQEKKAFVAFCKMSKMERMVNSRKPIFQDFHYLYL